jgi:alkylation response protein AidB-like acyl-CoA dehydrogenase
MSLTSEQIDFRDAIRDFAARECGTREKREAWLDPGENDHSSELYRRFADLGWLGVAVPEEFGGSGGSHVEQAILFEEIYRGLIPVKAAGASATVAGCFKRFGSDLQKTAALGAISAGAVAAISISEPEAGSDVANVAIRATPGDGGYLINGQKTWCSYAHLAERILLVARTSREEKRHRGLTLFDVPADTEGIEMRRIQTLGGREVNDVFFTDCFIPDDAIVGEVGLGFQQLMAGLDGERLLGAAAATGLAQRALDDLLAYVTQRRQFGRAIGTFQALKHRIADLATEVECCRLLTHEVAGQLSDGERNSTETTRLTSMAKLKCSEVAKHVALEGMQMMGGYGYATEYDMEAHVRHSLLLPIYAGTSEIQREIIGSTLGLG